MKSTYAWRCFACSATNLAGVDTCATCGFPAQASGRQIAEVRRLDGSAGRAVKGRSPCAFESAQAALKPLSPWRQLVAVVGAILFVGGLAAFKISWSFAALGWGLVALVMGILLLASAYSRAAD